MDYRVQTAGKHYENSRTPSSESSKSSAFTTAAFLSQATKIMPCTVTLYTQGYCAELTALLNLDDRLFMSQAVHHFTDFLPLCTRVAALLQHVTHLTVQ